MMDLFSTIDSKDLEKLKDSKYVACKKDKIPIDAKRIKNLILRGRDSGESNLGEQFKKTPTIPSDTEINI